MYISIRLTLTEEDLKLDVFTNQIPVSKNSEEDSECVGL